MKSITEILGDSQILLDISYYIQDLFEDFLTDKYRLFLSLLGVTEEFFPPVVTGINVHDSQLVISMEKMTELKITHLYFLMDAAYDASLIRSPVEKYKLEFLAGTVMIVFDSYDIIFLLNDFQQDEIYGRRPGRNES